MPETAAPVQTHKPWCVRTHERGACSTKRGHWDRSTNTWKSDLTDDDRRLMKWALQQWKGEGRPPAEVLEELREKSRAAGGTLGDVETNALNTWNMTQKRLSGMGRTWPI